MDAFIEDFMNRKLGFTFNSIEDVVLFLIKYKKKKNKNLNIEYVARQIFNLCEQGYIIYYDSFGLASSRCYVPNMQYKENLYEVELIWQV